MTFRCSEVLALLLGMFVVVVVVVVVPGKFDVELKSFFYLGSVDELWRGRVEVE